MNNSAWVSKATLNKKPWGQEIVASNSTNIAAKLITINKNEKTSFKYNNIKFEALVILKGKVKAIYANSNFLKEEDCELKMSILSEGDCLNIQPGCPYRLEAITTTQLLEIGNCTNSPDFNTIRLIDDYGRESKKVTKYQQEKIKRCIRNL